MQCRRDSGEARAYDAHIRIHRTGKRRKVACVIDAGGVVRPCVRPGLFHIVVLILTMLTGRVNEAMILVSSAAVGIQSKKNGWKNSSRAPNWSAVAYAVLFVCE
jgi:hypothetical protein